MDSVDSCCGLRKPDGFQNAQEGSNPKKVDLIIWEIEVPKVRAASAKRPQVPGQRAWERGPRWGPKPGEAPWELEAEGMGMLRFAWSLESSGSTESLQLPLGVAFSHSPAPPFLRALLGVQGSDQFGDASKARLRTGAGQESPQHAFLTLSNADCIL